MLLPAVHLLLKFKDRLVDTSNMVNIQNLQKSMVQHVVKWQSRQPASCSCCLVQEVQRSGQAGKTLQTWIDVSQQLYAADLKAAKGISAQ